MSYYQPVIIVIKCGHTYVFFFVFALAQSVRAFQLYTVCTDISPGRSVLEMFHQPHSSLLAFPGLNQGFKFIDFLF